MSTGHRPRKKLKALALVTLGSLLAFESSTGAQSTHESNIPPAVAPRDQRAAMDPLQVMMQSLDLSDQQAKNLEPVLKEQRDKINALRRETSLTRQQRMAKLREMQQDTGAKIKVHLTPEQAEKWQGLKQGQRGAFGRQGLGFGNGNSVSTGLQAQNAQPELPTWRSRPQPPPQAQAQPAQPATAK